MQHLLTVHNGPSMVAYDATLKFADLYVHI